MKVSKTIVIFVTALLGFPALAVGQSFDSGELPVGPFTLPPGIDIY